MMFFKLSCNNVKSPFPDGCIDYFLAAVKQIQQFLKTSEIFMFLLRISIS